MNISLFSEESTVYFGCYDDIDDILKQFKDNQLIFLTKPPRKILRRIQSHAYCDMLAIPPYIETNYLLLNEKDLLAIGYLASLVTSNMFMLRDLLKDKIILSPALPGEFSCRSICIAYLLSNGFKCIEWNQDASYTEECQKTLLARLTRIYKPKHKISNLNGLLEIGGFKTFAELYKKAINDVNSGKYNHNLFKDDPKDLDDEEMYERLLLSRQAISRSFLRALNMVVNGQ